MVAVLLVLVYGTPGTGTYLPGRDTRYITSTDARTYLVGYSYPPGMDISTHLVWI
eukprot:SAG31_NODE_37487_length_303_cov_42.740196_1_plen_54_part_10